jgi:hypothetical protein
VPCIASSAGATREAGGDLAAYFDPTRRGDLMRAMATWITDESALVEARARITRALASGKFASWNDAGRVLLGEAGYKD